jgi:hypothetical protein
VQEVPLLTARPFRRSARCSRTLRQNLTSFDVRPVAGEFVLRAHAAIGVWIQPATVLPPTIGFEARTSGLRCRDRRFSLQPGVSGDTRCSSPGTRLTSSPIRCCPKQRPIQTLSTDCSDQPLNEHDGLDQIGCRSFRTRFYFPALAKTAIDTCAAPSPDENAEMSKA